MKNRIISYSNLTLELKKAFRHWLNFSSPDLVSFPLQGKHMKGYIFNHEEQNYLVVMKLQNDEPFNSGFDNLDINEEF